MKDNEFAEYIDNEMMCTKLGVPCKIGIPQCTMCFTADNRNVNKLHSKDANKRNIK